MKLLSTRRHRIAVAVTAAAVTIGGGSAAAVALTTPASAGTASLSAVTKPAATGGVSTRHHHRRGLLARTDHATFELKVKGHWVTYDLDRGKVTAVSATSISLARPDGQSVTMAITGATRFGHHTSVATVKTGARATVTSANGTARRIVQGHHAKTAAAPATSTTAA